MEGYIARSPNANATWTIIGLNLLIGFFTEGLRYSSPKALEEIILRFSAIPIFTMKLIEPYRLITSMFLHGGFIHLFLNMFALFIFGPDIERVLGKVRYLFLYFFSGVAADFAHAYFIASLYPHPRLLITPSIGASGAIYGVMAAFAVLFPFRRIMIFVGFPFIAPALVAIAAMAMLQTLYALFDPFSQVAYAAHIGGFLAGLILTMIYKPSLKKVRFYL